MGRGKVQVYHVRHGDTERLIKGTLKQVESKLRGEMTIEPCSPEQAHQLAETAIEDATGEP